MAGIIPRFRCSKKRENPACALFAELLKHCVCEYDDAGSIGRRYRRCDEIGTPFCLTFDFQSLDGQAVTIRHRDDGVQQRIPIAQLPAHLRSLLEA